MASIGMTKTLPSTDYKYVIGDVTKMPFKDDEFDTVIDTFGLQYVINPTRALQEIRRYLTIYLFLQSMQEEWQDHINE